MMDTAAYLRRIQYQGDLNPSPEVLAGLQLAHLLHVPFENLDIHLGVKIDLNSTYEKVVLRHRGGFCFELNSLFFQLLQHLGFDAHLIAGRVYDREQKTYGAEFDHMAIRVILGGQSYISDVGFGEFSFTPIPLIPGEEHVDARGVFVIDHLDSDSYIIYKIEEDLLVPQYRFTLIPRQPEEFLGMCAFHQTSPLSHFTQKRICSLPAENGRITLTGNTLKITTDGNTAETVIEEREIHDVLMSYFGIRL